MREIGTVEVEQRLHTATITETLITLLTLTQTQIEGPKIMRRLGGESGSLLFAKLIAS